MYPCIISYCAAFYLSTFSHDAVRILASPESIACGALNCKTGELKRDINYPFQVELWYFFFQILTNNFALFFLSIN